MFEPRNLGYRNRPPFKYMPIAGLRHMHDLANGAGKYAEDARQPKEPVQHPIPVRFGEGHAHHRSAVGTAWRFPLQNTPKSARVRDRARHETSDDLCLEPATHDDWTVAGQ